MNQFPMTSTHIDTSSLIPKEFYEEVEKEDQEYVLRAGNNFYTLSLEDFEHQAKEYGEFGENVPYGVEYLNYAKAGDPVYFDGEVFCDMKTIADYLSGALNDGGDTDVWYTVISIFRKLAE